MGQFFTVLKFELENYFKQKSFILSTIIISLVMVVGLSLPNFIDMSSILPVGDSDTTKVEEVKDKDKTNFAIYDEQNIISDKSILNMYFEDSNWKVVKKENELNKLVENEDVEAAFNVKSLTEYDYIVENTSLSDTNDQIFNELMKKIYVSTKVSSEGMDFNKVDAIYNTQVVSNVEILGKDSANNFMYGYILIFVLYIMIAMYGQLIATSITTEKSNRAIEVLVTSTNTNNLIFGKVIAGAIASIAQVVVIMSSALISYKINSDVWNGLLDNIFKIPSELLIAFAVFGILGYLFYSFMFAALGALVSKTEELGTSLGPVLMIFIVVFMISMTGLSNGDSTLMKVCSYIPFASPMTMIARVSGGYVTSMEFIISSAILILSNIGAGICVAKIYRMATLMYGNPIKLKNALKWLKPEEKR